MSRLARSGADRLFSRKAIAIPVIDASWHAVRLSTCRVEAASDRSNRDRQRGALLLGRIGRPRHYLAFDWNPQVPPTGVVDVEAPESTQRIGIEQVSTRRVLCTRNRAATCARAAVGILGSARPDAFPRARTTPVCYSGFDTSALPHGVRQAHRSRFFSFPCGTAIFSSSRQFIFDSGFLHGFFTSFARRVRSMPFASRSAFQSDS